MSTVLTDTSPIGTLTPEELSQLCFTWAGRVVPQKGTKVCEETHNWHTEERWELRGYGGLLIEYSSGLSQYGNEYLKISKGDEPVLTASGQCGKTTNHSMVTPPNWISPLQDELVQMMRQLKREQETAARYARTIRLHRPKAEQLAGKNLQVTSITLGASVSHIHALVEGKKSGLLPLTENWKGKAISVSLGGVTISVNEKHPDYDIWLSLRLLEEPKFRLRDKPTRYILPAFARYLEIIEH